MTHRNVRLLEVGRTYRIKRQLEAAANGVDLATAVADHEALLHHELLNEECCPHTKTKREPLWNREVIKPLVSELVAAIEAVLNSDAATAVAMSVKAQVRAKLPAKPSPSTIRAIESGVRDMAEVAIDDALFAACEIIFNKRSLARRVKKRAEAVHGDADACASSKPRAQRHRSSRSKP